MSKEDRERAAAQIAINIAMGGGFALGALGAAFAAEAKTTMDWLYAGGLVVAGCIFVMVGVYVKNRIPSGND